MLAKKRIESLTVVLGASIDSSVDNFTKTPASNSVELLAAVQKDYKNVEDRKLNFCHSGWLLIYAVHNLRLWRGSKVFLS